MVKIKQRPSKGGAVAPVMRYATPGSAAVDLHACIDAAVTIPPGGLAMIPAGFSMELPEGYAAYVFARSGLAAKFGVALSNGVGVIDSDYRGEVTVGLINNGQAPYELRPMERIAQMAVMPVFKAVFEVSEELSETTRGEGGFGSTGRN